MGQGLIREEADHNHIETPALVMLGSKQRHLLSTTRPEMGQNNEQVLLPCQHWHLRQRDLIKSRNTGCKRSGAL